MAVAAKRNDVGVLHQQELIADQPLLALTHQFLLQGEGGGVIHPPQVPQLAITH